MTTDKSQPPFAHTRAYDLAFAVPAAVFYALAAAYRFLSWPWHAPTLVQIAQGAYLMYFALQALLLLSRRLPVAKTDAFWPRAAAMLGANIGFTLLFIPSVLLHDTELMISTFLMAAGTVGAIIALAWLRRAFSILPEARQLVTSGPYRFIRHPEYLAEMIATCGVMLGYRQPWAGLIVIVSIWLQFQRMNFEEDILRRTYPEYAAYSRRTARLIPGVY